MNCHVLEKHTGQSLSVTAAKIYVADKRREKKRSRLYMHSFSLKSHDGRLNTSCLLGNHFLPGNFIKCSSFKSWTKFLN